jgi:hypothetical protein
MLRAMRLAAVAVLVAAAPAAAAPVRTAQSDPHPGIHRETWVDSAIPARVELVRVDLTSSEIAVYATKQSDRGLTTSEFAARATAQVAINGDAFAVAGYVPRGLAIGASDPWPNTADDAASAVFHLARVGERTEAGIVPPEAITTPADLPEGTEGAVSGRPLLVRAGVVAAQFDCADPVTLACERAPRSAVALSADGSTMWLVTVDGWQAGSLGMTAAELAAFLQGLGADSALALDGGSSSTLVLDGNVINSPSDGVERTVANHLAVKYGSLPKGELYGLVCKHTVINCSGDVTKYVVGAQVTLDDGRVQTTGAASSFDFLSVTPRLACVTVKKTGYLSKRQCRQVVPGDITYNSVALWEGTDPLDAGVPDASPARDGANGRDAGAGDGGNGAAGPGGGCCDAGRQPPPALLFALVAWFLTRRRGTTA